MSGAQPAESEDRARGRVRTRVLVLLLSALCSLLSRPLPAQSDSAPRSVRLDGGVVEFEARRDGWVGIGAVGTVRLAVAAGAFAPIAVLTWFEQVEALASAAASAGGAAGESGVRAIVGDTVPLLSMDGALLILATRGRSAADAPGVLLTFVRGGSAPLQLQLFIPPDAVPGDEGAGPPLPRLRAAATAAAERARAIAPRVAALGHAGTPDGRRPGARMPTPDRLFIILSLGLAGAVAGANADGAQLGCETYSCWRAGTEGFALGGALGYALGGVLTRERAYCGAGRAFVRAGVGAALGAIPGFLLARRDEGNFTFPVLMLGQGTGAVVGGRRCR